MVDILILYVIYKIINNKKKMGNLQLFSSSQYQDPKVWRVLTKKCGYTLIKNNQTGEELEKHVISVNCNQMNQVQIESYAQRIKNGDKYAIKCVNVFKDTQNNFCQSHDIILVMTQRITRFSDIRKLEKLEMLDKKIEHSFKQALKSYRFLIHKYNKFQVSSHHIGYNKAGEIKMWINKEFGLNCIENPINYIFSEEAEIKNIHRMFNQRLIQKDHDFQIILQNIQKPLTLDHMVNFLEVKDSNKISLHKTPPIKSTLNQMLTKVETPKFALNKIINKQNTQSHDYLKVPLNPYYVTITPSTSQHVELRHSNFNNSNRQTKSWMLDKSTSKIQDFSSNNNSTVSFLNNTSKIELKKCSSTQLLNKQKPKEEDITQNMTSKFKMYLHCNKMKQPSNPNRQQQLKQNFKLKNSSNRLSLSGQLRKQPPRENYQMQANLQNIIIKVDSLLVIENEENVLKVQEDKHYDNSILIESQIVRRLDDEMLPAKN